MLQREIEEQKIRREKYLKYEMPPLGNLERLLGTTQSLNELEKFQIESQAFRKINSLISPINEQLVGERVSRAKMEIMYDRVMERL